MTVPFISVFFTSWGYYTKGRDQCAEGVDSM
uniref:Uncharacterized protein n=1 Tax=Trichinella nativa TaxID=6335 RepID=A0A0V1KHS4_9BILA